MRLDTVGRVIAAAVALILSVAMGASPVIGTVVTKGAFRIDGASVRGNATLVEGTVIETHTAASTLELTRGVRLQLAAETRGRVFGDRLTIERGQAQLDKGPAYQLEARGLTIRPDTGSSIARVALASSSRVQVVALAGSFRVLTSKGVLVAAMPTGAALEFETQASQRMPTKLTGCLVRKGTRFVLTDDTTNVTVELAGAGLEKEVGNRVEITGAMDPTATPVPDATQLIRVSAVKRVAKGCGGRGGAAAGAGAGAAAGISATTIAIIGGVAAAAAVGGLAAAGKLPGQDDDTTAPVSR